MDARRSLTGVLILALLATGTGSAQRGGGTIQPPEGRGGRGGDRQVTPARDVPGGPAEAPRGTAIIRGVVLAADTGTPIRRAQVRASAASARTNRLATTDAQGRFEIKELPAGRYTLSAMKSGFVSLQFGQRRPSESGTPLEISDAQLLDKVVIGLPRGSVIAGRITDEFGEPLANAAVTAMRYGYSGGARRLLPANARDTTDDLGAFRLFGLPPGEYVVSASFRAGGEVTDPAGEPSGYAPTYFPGTPNVSEAQRIRVDVGQENAGAIFALVATRLVRISGTLINSQGMPVTNGNVMLAPADSLGVGPMPMNSARLERDGVFRITNVAPGRYVLQARTNPAPAAARGGRGPAAAAGIEMGRLEFVVGTDDISGLVVATMPGATMTGTVAVDGPQQPPFGPEQVQVSSRPVQPAQAMPTPGGNARVGADWTFQITGIFDARLIRASAPQGWTTKTVTFNGQDVTDTPIEIPPGQTAGGFHVVLTDKVTNLSGRVVDARGDPVASAAVVIFPADERLWTFQSRFIRAARPDQQGRYQLTGLPPYDDYRILALSELEDGQAGDPEFLMRVREQGSRFSLNEGETKSVDVKLGR
jgi:hypothetical protein